MACRCLSGFYIFYSIGDSRDPEENSLDAYVSNDISSFFSQPDEGSDKSNLLIGLTIVKEITNKERGETNPNNIKIEQNTEVLPVSKEQLLEAVSTSDSKAEVDATSDAVTKSDKKVINRRFYSCEECGKLVDYYKYDRHMRTHTGEKPYVCCECHKQFTRADILNIHMRIHTGEKPYKCATCGMSFSRSDLLQSHLRHHTGDLLRCEHCDKKFTRPERLRSHLVLHTGEKSFSCSICLKDFSRADNLRTHMKVHTGERYHRGQPCANCEVVAGQYTEEGGLFPCHICKKVFPLACRLAAHMCLHTGEKPFPCHVCGKSFALSYRLLLHMRTHTGERPYQCNECGKAFPRNHNLKQHMRIHSGEKPYRCEECGKSYTQSKTLKEHMRIHTGEKPFVCPTCSKQFSRIDNLKVHLLTHTDNKRHMCSFCGKKYADLRCFQKHVQSHQEGRPLDCTMCGLKFINQKTLKNHMKSHLPVSGSSSSVIGESCYICSLCGQQMTVQASTNSQLILIKNCDCSNGVVMNLLTGESVEQLNSVDCAVSDVEVKLEDVEVDSCVAAMAFTN